MRFNNQYKMKKDIANTISSFLFIACLESNCFRPFCRWFHTREQCFPRSAPRSLTPFQIVSYSRFRFAIRSRQELGLTHTSFPHSLWGLDLTHSRSGTAVTRFEYCFAPLYLEIRFAQRSFPRLRSLLLGLMIPDRPSRSR